MKTEYLKAVEQTIMDLSTNISKSEKPVKAYYSFEDPDYIYKMLGI